MAEGDQIDVKKRSIVKRVKLLCDILEIDHLGLVSVGIKRLQDYWNKYVVREGIKLDIEDFKNFREYYGGILNLLCFEIPMRIIIALIDNMKEECELK